MINSSNKKEYIIKIFWEPQEHFCPELQLNILVFQEEWEAYETKKSVVRRQHNALKHTE